MNYRCPNCRQKLALSKLFFSDISACKECGQKVVLGDFLAFSLASLAMMVMALSALYTLLHRVDDYVVAGGYALAIGMTTGLVILLLLGKASAYRPIGFKRKRPEGEAPRPTTKY